VGVADRGYMRGRAPDPVAFGSSWTLRFLVLLGVAYLLWRGAASWWGWTGWDSLLLSREAIAQGRVWTLLTSALLHDDTWQLVFNLIGLWFFGKLAEESLRGRRFVAFFVLSAVAAHLPFLAAEFATHGGARAIGASGIVLAALVYAAFRYPGLPVMFWFLPMKLWQLAALWVAFDVYDLLSRGPRGGHWTHVGGAAFGFAVSRWGLLPRATSLLPHRGRPPREAGPYASGNVQAEVDRILDKINAQGIGALTPEEREFLTRNSGRYE
jgi:membrane associated rhomboid family serine protease